MKTHIPHRTSTSALFLTSMIEFARFQCAKNKRQVNASSLCHVPCHAPATIGSGLLPKNNRKNTTFFRNVQTIALVFALYQFITMGTGAISFTMSK